MKNKEIKILITVAAATTTTHSGQKNLTLLTQENKILLTPILKILIEFYSKYIKTKVNKKFH